eukprot:scpid74683/ scgid19403/ 
MVLDQRYPAALRRNESILGQEPPPEQLIAVPISETESEPEEAQPTTQRGRCRRRQQILSRKARPESFIDSRSEKAKRSYRFSRRVANSREVAALHPIDEELSVEDICPAYNGLFGELFANAKSTAKWHSFTAMPEADQLKVLSVAHSGPHKVAPEIDSRARFRKTSRKFRDALRHNRRFAMPLVSDIEDLLRFALTSDSVLVLKLESSFHRLMAYGVVEYLGGEWTASDVNGERVIMVTCRRDLCLPEKCLADV